MQHSKYNEHDRNAHGAVRNKTRLTFDRKQYFVLNLHFFFFQNKSLLLLICLYESVVIGKCLNRWTLSIILHLPVTKCVLKYLYNFNILF